MSKFDDDVIQSLKEPLAHARGNGSGTEHTSLSPRGLDADDAQADSDGTIDEAD